MKALVISAAILFLLSINGFSQQNSDSTQMWKVTTVDGNNFLGFIVEESAQEIVLKTFGYQQIVIKRAIITSITEVNTSKKKAKKALDKNITINSDTLWRVVNADGYEFIGVIENEDDGHIELSTEKFGVINIQKSSIKSITPVKGEQYVNGNIWFSNPQSARYLWAPNGYGLKKGEGYYQNVWVMFNQLSYGFADYFSAGIGTMPLFLFNGTATPVWVTPKFSIPIVKNKLNVGVGAMAGVIVGGESAFAVPYGVITYGGKNSNVTFGMGYGFFEGDSFEKPIYTLAGITRVSKRSYLLSENYYIKTDDVSLTMLSIGGRTVWNRISLDYCLVFPIEPDMDYLIAIPWLSLVIPFSK